MNFEQFLSMIEIDEGGYHPFHGMMAIEGEIHMMAFAGLRMEGVYKSILSLYFQNIGKGINQVYYAADFPAGLGLETDFVGVFKWEVGDKTWSVTLIPYRPNGERIAIAPSEHEYAKTTLITQSNHFLPFWRLSITVDSNVEQMVN